MEHLVDLEKQAEWLRSHQSFSIYAGVGYLVVVKSLESYMSKRPAINLRYPLAIWSLLLGIFSVRGAWATLPEALGVAYREGYTFSICRATYRQRPEVVFWFWLFTWSKLAEFGDTVFVVLRKQPLIPLHYWHHFLTCIYCFTTYHELPSTLRYGAAVNYAVHAVMYNYYALKALRVPVPRSISMAITAAQIAQMIFGFALNFQVAYHVLVADIRCDTTPRTALFAVLMTALYIYLFGAFFVKSYLGKDSKTAGIDHSLDANNNCEHRKKLKKVN